MSFPAGSAGGPDGLRLQHLKDLISAREGPGSVSLVESLTRFVNFVCSGKVLAAARPYFFGASLIAFSKPDGGVRPIAVGCTLRRLAAKCASHAVRGAMADLLAPTQLGYGTSMGAEAAVHATRTYLQHMPEDHLLLKLDFSNAFNSVRRDKMLQACLLHAPALYPLVHSAYSKSSYLFFESTIIDSAEGVQQGDPLGPLLFSLSIHSMVSQLKSAFTLFYLDDGTLGGSSIEVRHDLQSLEASSRELGLVLNRGKTEIVCSDPITVSSLQSISPDFRCVAPSEACLLGSPIGDFASVNRTLQAKFDALKTIGERLSFLHSQDALLLLRNVFSLPKVLYVLRTAPCFESPLLQEMNNLQRDLLQTICNVELNDVAWIQASLPISAGGLGIRSFTQLAPSAYLASAAGSSNISNQILPTFLRDVFNPLKSMALASWRTGHNADAPSGSSAPRQKAWDTPRIEATSSTLLSLVEHDTVAKGRLLATRQRESGAWLMTLSVSSIGLRMDDDTIRNAVGLRLGTSLCLPHPCHLCGSQVESTGVHGLSCRRSLGRHVRHSSVNDIICRSLTAAGVPCQAEPHSLSRVDGKRPDGVTMLPWKHGRPLVWDVTYSDTYAQSYQGLAASRAGAVADQAERRKASQYSHLEGSHFFAPVSVETTGAMGTDTIRFLREIARKIATRSGEPNAYQHLIQRISVAVQQGNSISIMGTFKPTRLTSDSCICSFD